MTKFLSKNLYTNTVVALLIAIAAKFFYFIHPQPIIHQSDDGVIYDWLIKYIEPLPLLSVQIIAIVFIYLQAIIFNQIIIALKLFSKKSNVSGLAFILISSLIPQWNCFSAALLVNFFMLLFFFLCSTIYLARHTQKTIFILGVLIGLMSLIQIQALLLSFWGLLVILILRPADLKNFVIYILGIFVLYYFYASYLFVFDRWHFENYFFIFKQFQAVEYSVLQIILFSMLLLSLILGFYKTYTNFSKLQMKEKKLWDVLYWMLLLLPYYLFYSTLKNFGYLQILMMPLAALMAGFFWYTRHKLLSVLLFVATVILIAIQQV